MQTVEGGLYIRNVQKTSSAAVAEENLEEVSLFKHSSKSKLEMQESNLDVMSAVHAEARLNFETLKLKYEQLQEVCRKNTQQKQ